MNTEFFTAPAPVNIALTGGGARAAFQGGFLYRAFRDYIDAPVGQVSALSGGVINAYFLTTRQVSRLKEVWTEIIPAHTDRMRWKLGVPLNMLLRRKGFVNPSFSMDLIRRFITEIPDRMTVDVVSLVDGVQHTLGAQDFVDLQSFHNALYASTAVPGVFPPVDIATASGPIRQASDGGIYGPAPLPQFEEDFLVSAHPSRNQEESQGGPIWALMRVVQLRATDRADYTGRGRLVRPESAPKPAWNWSYEALAYNFQLGEDAAVKLFNTQT